MQASARGWDIQGVFSTLQALVPLDRRQDDRTFVEAGTLSDSAPTLSVIVTPMSNTLRQSRYVAHVANALKCCNQ